VPCRVVIGGAIVGSLVAKGWRANEHGAVAVSFAFWDRHCWDRGWVGEWLGILS
jgi:hypothetical protein